MMFNLLQKFFVSQALRGTSTILSFTLILVSQFVVAQTNVANTTSAQAQPIDNEWVEELLTDIQGETAGQSETAGQRATATREVFNTVNGFKVADVAADSPFRIIKKRGDWHVIKFDTQVISGWVSKDYLTISDGMATISATKLNVRLKPNFTAKRITTVPRGYRSKIIEQRDGFALVSLPSDQEFAVLIGVSDVPTSDASKAELGQRLSPATASTLTSQDEAQPAKAEESVELTEVLAKPQLSGERRHKIAPGDAVSLLVFGESDLSIENVRVPQSGRVSFPLIGSIAVAGKTTAQVEVRVSELLSQGYVRNPRLSVTIFSYRPVFIRGAVRETGSYPFTEGLSIAKAIALAGGSKNSAKRDGVNVSRDGKVVAQNLSIDSEAEVASGDVISVAEEIGVGEESASYIYMHGEVPSPGEYPYRKGLTVEKAIVLAGGFTIRASRKKISVTRYAEQDENGKPKRLRRVKLYEPIEPGDVIVVGASWF